MKQKGGVDSQIPNWVNPSANLKYDPRRDIEPLDRQARIQVQFDREYDRLEKAQKDFKRIWYKSRFNIFPKAGDNTLGRYKPKI